MPESFHHRDRCAIAGIGATDFSPRLGPQRPHPGDPGVARRARRRRPGRRRTSTASCAATWTSSGTTTWSDALGIRQPRLLQRGRPRRASRPCAMVGQAVAAILSGQATTVLVFRSLNGRSGRRYGAAARVDASDASAATAPTTSSSCRTACSRRVRSSRCMAQRHMLDFGTTREGPRPHRPGLPGPGQRQPGGADARPAAHDGRLPRRPDDLPPAAALRLLPGDRRRLRRRRDQRRAGPGLAAAAGPHPGRRPGQPAGPAAGHPVPGRCCASRITTLPAKPTADTLYRRGRPRPGRHRRRPALRLLHDHRAAAARGLRLLRQGRGRRVRGERRASSSDGPLPINTGGGHLSEGYIHGMNHVVEGGPPDPRRRRPPRCQAPRSASSRPTPLPPGSALILRRTDDRRPDGLPRRSPTTRHRRLLRAAAAASWRCATATAAAPCCTCRGPTAGTAAAGTPGTGLSRRGRGCTRGRWWSTRSIRPIRCRTPSCWSSSPTSRPLGWSPSCPAQALHPGQELRACFERLENGTVLVQWRPADAGDEAG